MSAAGIFKIRAGNITNSNITMGLPGTGNISLSNNISVNTGILQTTTILGTFPSQAQDSDLTSLSLANQTGVLYYRSTTGTWSPVSIGTGLTFVAGLLNTTI